MGITGRFTKLINSIPTEKPGAASVPQSFIDSRLANFAIPAKVLTDHRPHFILEILLAICSELRIKPLKSTDRYRQATGQVAQ